MFRAAWLFTEQVVTGPGGGIAVGPKVWTDEDNHVQIGNGDLYFADGSYTVIKAEAAANSPIFTTTSDIAKSDCGAGCNFSLREICRSPEITQLSAVLSLQAMKMKAAGSEAG